MGNLTKGELEQIRRDIFTNPVTEISSYSPIAVNFDWLIWVRLRPGVMDAAAKTAVEAISDSLKKDYAKDIKVFTSTIYTIVGKLTREDVELIAKELLANDLIQEWKLYSSSDWNPEIGIGLDVPLVDLMHVPNVETYRLSSIDDLVEIDKKRNMGIHKQDMPYIVSYFQRKEILEERRRVGLSDPTDIELEMIAQARSDHCNHNTFNGRFFYRENKDAPQIIIKNLFEQFIKEPTLAISKKREWVVSVLWDNAGVGRFDEGHLYTITAETHNSPSTMEAYGGALTGIVGVYRDPMGTGLGSKLICGFYGYCVGPWDYNGPLKPHLHPRRLLEGVIEGVKDGGNKSGIPTVFGQVLFDHSFLGKCLVFVGAIGIMPDTIKGKPAHEKRPSPGDLIIMVGGRVGKDGIHGVTASSQSYTSSIPAGHVQIGDPYTQKKMHDFLIEARDLGLIRFITDNGGGGLSSSIGESARLAGGCLVHLDRVPLKYEGLDPWEIWISESQERMTVAIHPDSLDKFMELSRKHEVESTLLGEYTDTGFIHLKHKEKTCAYIRIDFFETEFPQWEFDACWVPPEERGLREPIITEPIDYNRVLLDILKRPNICSKAWIARQYDHEVQGGSVIKPLIGETRDLPSDASVLRPILDSKKGIALAQGLLPFYSRIDTYDMTLAAIDEAVRRVIAVGGSLEHIAGIDNFCWPTIQPAKDNPDASFKAAQLVRAAFALKEACMSFSIPLLSGKDSMYIDGYLKGKYGEVHKVSGLPTMMFTALSLIEDIEKCVTMEPKAEGDIVYILGETFDELGASEYYEMLGHIGINTPKLRINNALELYQAVEKAISNEIFTLVHGIYRGGLLTHLSMIIMGSSFGLKLSIDSLLKKSMLRIDKLLFSESLGRFIVTLPSEKESRFKEIFNHLPYERIGNVTCNGRLTISIGDNKIVDLSTQELYEAWTERFGDMI